MQAMAFKGSNPPDKAQENYTLGETKIKVSYRELSAKYAPDLKVCIGQLVYDVQRKHLGTCLHIGHRRGLKGTRCTIQGNRRNSHSDLEDCIPVPRLGTHLQQNEKWFQVTDLSNKTHAVIVPLLALEEEEDIDKLFASGEEADGPGGENTSDTGARSDESTRATRAAANAPNTTPTIEVGTYT